MLYVLRETVCFYNIFVVFSAIFMVFYVHRRKET